MQRTAHEKTLLILSGLTVIVIFPFAMLRLWEDILILAIIDSLIVGVGLIIFLYVYKTHKVELPSIVLAFVVTTAAIASITIKGISQVYWIYPAMISTYYLVKPKIAVINGSIAMIAVFVLMYDIADFVTKITITATTILTNLFAYIFSESLRKKHVELTALATTDSLTGAGNRRALAEKLGMVIKEQSRNPTSVCLILLDIDHFKRVNDDFGHLVGDKALSDITNVITNRIRQTEAVYRYGGEEFIIAPLPIPLAEARNLAEKLRGLIEFTEIIPGQTVTISLGVAQYKSGETVSNWIDRADQALYDAKNSGRNKVSVATKSQNKY